MFSYTAHQKKPRLPAYPRNTLWHDNAFVNHGVRLDKEIKTTKQKSLYDLRFNEGGTQLATRLNNDQIKRWDSKTGKCLNKFRIPFNYSTLALGSQGDVVVTSNKKVVCIYDVVTKDGLCKIYDTGNPPSLTIYNETLFASGEDDGSAYLWKLSTMLEEGCQKIKLKASTPLVPSSLAFNAIGNKISALSKTGILSLWNLNGECLHTIQLPVKNNSYIILSSQSTIGASQQKKGEIILYNVRCN